MNIGFYNSFGYFRSVTTHMYHISSVSFATVPLFFSQGDRQDKVHVGDRIIEVNGIAKAMWRFPTNNMWMMDPSIIY